MNATLQESKISGFRSQLIPTKLAFSASIVKQAEEFLQNNDFPTTRHEDWKYTRVTKISALQPSQGETKKVQDTTQYIVNPDAIRFVFQNGELHSDYSGVLPKDCASNYFLPVRKMIWLTSGRIQAFQ
jgi:hypothetical protein